MKPRNRPTSRKRLSADALELTRLANGMAEVGSRLEEKLWEKKIFALVSRLLTEGAEDELTMAIDRLADGNANAYGVLINVIESAAESCVMTLDKKEFDVLLINVPLLAWSRFAIPFGVLPKSMKDTLQRQLAAHVCAADANVVLLDYLFSPDQLPRSFTAVRQLTGELGTALLHKRPITLDHSAFPETNPFLSDTRYLLGAIAVPKGSALFRWNEADHYSRETACREWVRQGSPNLESMLTGCSFQLLLADAYHAACRQADIASRPYFLKASVAFLETSLGLPAERFRANIGAFYDKELEEYRVGFSTLDNEQIIHGVSWPILDAEDEANDVAGEIEALLREAGIKEIIVHTQQFPFEFCDDCGSPLYPNSEGDTSHVEPPEEEEDNTPVLH